MALWPADTAINYCSLQKSARPGFDHDHLLNFNAVAARKAASASYKARWRNHRASLDQTEDAAMPTA